MYLLTHLMTAAVAAASLPGATAIFDPDADPVEVGAGGAAAATFALIPAAASPVDEGGAATATSEGNPSDDATVATLMAPADAAESPPDGDRASIAPTAGALPDPRLVGPTWSATRYYSADAGGLAEVAEDSVITLDIEDDGRFDGRAGCNNYFGSFVASTVASATRSSASAASSFVIDGRVGSTRMMCDGLMAQEAAYLANFEGSVNFSVSPDGDALEMTDGTGAVVAEYVLFAPPILDKTWTATQYHSFEEDGLVDVLPGSAITLEMDVDAKLSGRAGCNTYAGAYDDLTRDSFAVVGPRTTEAFCDRPENVMEQERAYLQYFEDGSRLKWAILGDGALELRDEESGAVVALYDSGAEAVFDPLSASGATAARGAFAAVAVVAAAALL